MLDSVWLLVPVVMLAGLVRGYAGFGFAAIAVVGVNFVLAPQQSIPIVLMLDVICSVGLLKQALREADFATFKLLILGAILGIPMGMGLLFLIPEQPLKLLICIVILLISILLMFDLRLRNADRVGIKMGFGIASGIGTAGASVGGPMIVSYMLSSPLTATAQRATMILFFIVSETLAVGALFTGGLVDTQIVTLLAALLIPTLIAVRIGQWLFNRKPPKSLKHFALPILMMVSILGISASVSALI
ncbi:MULTISPECIES: sulfite exporter TauE/SafE family protein [unclassified Vibrio]|uniref:Probable membrane transporter protein n=1 Tax=Vibrio sp. HB236076 TaxID=3232307 RepID=A0AB39HCR0_9VIBR|nr:sulfite exporter TauE/SafE family protein [Vibrio sp. HB161653]MDP5255269.1 sulfite exporter TauE/SafE family protein [Vibrio sp. HB161653]